MLTVKISLQYVYLMYISLTSYHKAKWMQATLLYKLFNRASFSHITMPMQKKIKGDFQPWMPKITPSTSTLWSNIPFPEIVFCSFHYRHFCLASTGQIVATETDLLPNSQASLENNRAFSVLLQHTDTHKTQSKCFYLTDRNNHRKRHHFDSHRFGGNLNVRDLL